MRVSAQIWAGAAALLLAALSLALLWPGVAEYDTVAQYAQVLAGQYDDWHPPIMARLWALLHPLGGGQGPMFALQMGLWWLGIGLTAAALARECARTAAVAVLAVGAFPLFLGWQTEVLKDAQMAGAMLAATGIAAWWRLDGRPLPRAAVAAILVLLLYASFVRANGVFGTVPLAFGLLAIAEDRRLPMRLGLMLASVLALIALAGPVNHRLLGAEPTGVTGTLPVFDIAGIAHFAGPEAVPALPAAAWRAAEAKDCYRPFFWDPYGDDDHCGFVFDELHERLPGSALFRAWAGTAARHPLAYAAHRLAHWNSTQRWLVPARWPLGDPPARSEPNVEGLRSPGRAADMLDRAADWLQQGPWGVPILWLAAAFGLLATARGDDPRHWLARTLALSAVAVEASFLLVSIASDLRYHLWPMVATALGWCLVLGTPLRMRAAQLTLAALLALGATGLAARMLLPPAGGTYESAL